MQRLERGKKAAAAAATWVDGANFTSFQSDFFQLHKI
jgi:hypothetical protein